MKISLPKEKRLEKIKDILSEDAEVIVTFAPQRKAFKDSRNLEKKILRFLEVRPATLQDFSNSLGLNSNVIIKCVDSLLEKKSIKKRLYKGKIYFTRYD